MRKVSSSIKVDEVSVRYNSDTYTNCFFTKAQQLELPSWYILLQKSYFLREREIYNIHWAVKKMLWKPNEQQFVKSYHFANPLLQEIVVGVARIFCRL